MKTEQIRADYIKQCCPGGFFSLHDERVLEFILNLVTQAKEEQREDTYKRVASIVFDCGYGDILDILEDRVLKAPLVTIYEEVKK